MNDSEVISGVLIRHPLPSLLSSGPITNASVAMVGFSFSSNNELFYPQSKTEYRMKSVSYPPTTTSLDDRIRSPIHPSIYFISIDLPLERE